MKCFKPLYFLLFTSLVFFSFSPQSFGQQLNISELQKLSAKGDLEAKYLLGAKYWMGIGVKENYPVAVKLFQQAASQGHAGAQFNLGYIYEKGIVVPQDYVKACILYKAAAEKGYPDAEQSFSLLSKYMSNEVLEKVSLLATQAELFTELSAQSSNHSDDRVAMKSWLQSIQPAAGGRKYR